MMGMAQKGLQVNAASQSVSQSSLITIFLIANAITPMTHDTSNMAFPHINRFSSSFPPTTHPLFLHLNPTNSPHNKPGKPPRTAKQAPIKRRCLPLLLTPILPTKSAIPFTHQRLQLGRRHVLHHLSQQRIMSLHHETGQRRLALSEPRSLERRGGRNVDAGLVEEC